jgi:hypothetical protein
MDKQYIDNAIATLDMVNNLVLEDTYLDGVQHKVYKHGCNSLSNINTNTDRQRETIEQLRMLMDNIVYDTPIEHKAIAQDIYNRGMDAIESL